MKPALRGLRARWVCALLLPAVVPGLWLSAAQAANLQVTVLDEAGKPLPQAVVFLESPAAARDVKPMPGVEMAQVDRQFVPDVLAVTRGTQVTFPNKDKVRHHVYSFSPNKRFEIKLYAGTPANPVLFDKAGVAVLGCNIHDEMIGWVVVVDTPHVATTGGNGQAGLKGVPDGDYRLMVWHNRLTTGAPAQAQAVTVSGAEAGVTVRMKGLQP